MTRTCLILLAVLTLSALGLVTSQHHARKLFAELAQEQERARQLNVEYGQLQLESSTWAMHARIERIARQSLRMRPPEAGRVEIVDLSLPQAPAPVKVADAASAASGAAGKGVLPVPTTPGLTVPPAVTPVAAGKKTP
ncbi:MAG TPA: cell division protein FtsL [Burkholderiales bacterium]|nr:cell division protein FtsL [Burkholderiales bacterium]